MTILFTDFKRKKNNSVTENVKRPQRLSCWALSSDLVSLFGETMELSVMQPCWRRWISISGIEFPNPTSFCSSWVGIQCVHCLTSVTRTVFSRNHKPNLCFTFYITQLRHKTGSRQCCYCHCPDLMVLRSLEVFNRETWDSLKLWARETCSWYKQKLIDHSNGILECQGLEKIYGWWKDQWLLFIWTLVLFMAT